MSQTDPDRTCMVLINFLIDKQAFVHRNNIIGAFFLIFGE